MLNYKLEILLISLLLGGCKPSTMVTVPSSPPPVVATAILEGKEVQVNTLPHPFNLEGELPFAVWVDGKRLSLDMHELQAVGKALNIEFKQPNDTPELHSGEGWLYPFPLVKDGSN